MQELAAHGGASSDPRGSPPDALDPPSHCVLIASGFGDTTSGGGLFAIDGSRVERIDRISSMGLAFDGRRLARVLRCTAADANVGEVAVYDARGVQRYIRLDEAASVHDVVWDGEDLAVVCPWDNAVRWFSATGLVVHEIRYGGPRDSLHLNCVTRRGDRWYATAFGFGAFRGWDDPSRKAQGRLFDLATGVTVAGGLSAPHSPRWIDGMWMVCNSAERELVAIDEATGQIVRRVPCGHWTRGLAHDDDFFYVGACQRRATQESFGDCEIVVIDRRTWEVAERVVLPVEEVYDLVLTPRAILDGLRRGFDVNPLRGREQRQYRILTELGVDQPRHLWPSGDPLPWSDFRCGVGCAIPPVWAAGELREVAVRLTNRSSSFFTTAAPAPVYVSYKWTDGETGNYLDGRRAYRSRLPRTVFPAESLDMTALVVAPERVGKAVLKITLMQEGVTWFDDQAAGNAAELVVEIVPAARTESTVPLHASTDARATVG
jgi:Domain of unknown function (DUF4915)